MTAKELSIGVARIRDGFRVMQFSKGVSKGMKIWVNDKKILSKFASFDVAREYLVDPNELGFFPSDCDIYVPRYAEDAELALKLLEDLIDYGLVIFFRSDEHNEDTVCMAICRAYINFRNEN